ncbi:MAG: FG-GAP repeat protein [Deltaproteobacteria bacterium]|nr:FG-GAP repeat protein [Deltaproteobacteria bacterium]
MVAAPYLSDVAYHAGAAFLVSGSPSPASADIDIFPEFAGSSSQGWAGYSLAGGGDFNADGFSDFVVGEYGASSYTGAGYLILGTGL